MVTRVRLFPILLAVVLAAIDSAGNAHADIGTELFTATEFSTHFAQTFSGISDDCLRNHKPAAEAGFREGLNGRIHLPAATVDLWTRPNSLEPPEKLACLAFRDGRHEADLTCCRRGYLRALPFLLRKVQTAHERALQGVEPDSPATRGCLSSYRQGITLAERACRAVSLEASSRCLSAHALESASGHVGCFHLGFATSYSSCARADDVREFLERNGLSLSRNPGGKPYEAMVVRPKPPATARSAQ